MKIKLELIVLTLLSLPLSLFSSDWVKVEVEGLEKCIVESVCCPDSGNCFAVAQYSTFVRLYKSTDKGLTWSVVNQSDPFNEEGDSQYLINATKGVSPHPDYFYMTFWDAPFMKKSSDGGETFRTIRLDSLTGEYSKKVYDIAMYDSSVGFAVSGDWCFTTHTNWEDFEKREFKLPSGGYYSPIFLDSVTVVMTYYSSKDEFDFLFVKYDIEKNEWVIFDEYTSDSEYKHTIQSICFVNDTLGFACGQQLTGIADTAYDLIYRTTDGGHNWELVLKRLEDPAFGLQDIAFHDEKNGVAVGQFGKIYLTKDGGDTWILSEIPEGINDALFAAMVVTWAGHYPIAGGYLAGIFRYEGDFFDFGDDTTGNDTPVIVAEDYAFARCDIHAGDTLSKKIKIRNTSKEKDLVITGYSELTETAFWSDLLAVDSSNPIIIKPEGYYDYTVYFSPKEVNFYKDSIVFYSNAQYADSVAYFRGEGFALPIIQADDYDFGEYDISNEDSLSIKLKIRNTSSDADLEVTGYSELTDSAFSTDLPSLESHIILMRPNEDFEYTVYFSPKEERDYRDSIVFYSNAEDSDRVAYFTGEGIDTTTSVIEFDGGTLELGVHYDQSRLRVLVDKANGSQIDIRLYNLNGVTLKSKTEELSDGFNTYYLDIHDLSSGVYIYNIAIDGFIVETGKMSIVR